MSTKDWIEKDFYKVLGVSASASADEIKKTYRKLAKQYHPDTNVGDAKAEERFKEVSEAYDVLSSDEKRREYDEARRLFASGARPGGFGGGSAGYAGGAGPDMGDLFGDGGFGDLLGGLFGGGGRRRTGPARGNDLETHTTIGFHDSLRGVTVSLRLIGQTPCSTCAGSGAKPGTTPRQCATCGGTGSTARNAGGFGFSEPCRDCRGQGAIIDNPCATCRGAGRVEQARTVQAKVPAGVKDGMRIRLAGQGAPGERGGAAGDLYVTVQVAQHPVFGRSGDNVTLTVPVTFPEAALGAKIDVPTPLDGDVTIALPAGTTTGRVLRVKGKGATKRDGSRGDMLVTIDVSVPHNLTSQARSALEAYAAATSEHDPRETLAAYRGSR
jgi:molecular chaperone DnaJ